MSCFKAGNYAMMGRGSEKSMETAYEFYKKGCDNEYGAPCHNAGLLKCSARLGKPDMKQGAEYFQLGCDYNNAPSCQKLSTMYIKGAEGLQKDMGKAAVLATKACEANDIPACVNLSQMYMRGEGVTKDTKLAEKFKTKALELHDNIVKREDQLTFSQ